MSEAAIDMIIPFDNDSAPPPIDIADVMREATKITDSVLDSCPVKPLGHRDGRYYFTSPVGEFRMMLASDFSVNGLSSLFEGSIGWLLEHFPRDRKGSTETFNAPLAAQYLMRACADEGLFDNTMPVRGVGVWRAGGLTEKGKEALIVHCGNIVWFDGHYRRSGFKLYNALYPAAPAIPAPASIIATAEDGQLLRDIIKQWRWRKPEIDVDLFLGFLAQAMLGGAPSWRAHMMINGQHGSGKSTLANLASCVLGGAAHPKSNNYTEAGLRQALTGEARCLILDEAEAEENGRIGRVVELLRHMSGGDGVKALRGSAGGQAQGYSVTGCALMLSILRVPLKPQDKSRITVLHIESLEDTSPESFADIEKHLVLFKQMSGAFRARMIARWDQFNDAVQFYRSSFISNGLSSRGADQLATIFAGRDQLLFDVPMTSSSIDDEMEYVQSLVSEEIEDRVENEGTQCLNHLYSSMVDNWRGGEKQTLAQLIAELYKEAYNKFTTENRKLGMYGLRFIQSSDGGKPKGLVIATAHQGLEKLYSGTRWSNGAWIGALEYLGGDRVGSQRFGGAVSKGLVIGEIHLPIESEDT